MLTYDARKIKHKNPKMNHYAPLPATAKNSEYGARISFFFILPLTHD
jgi:hypothetical protein